MLRSICRIGLYQETLYSSQLSLKLAISPSAYMASRRGRGTNEGIGSRIRHQQVENKVFLGAPNLALLTSQADEMSIGSHAVIAQREGRSDNSRLVGTLIAALPDH